jgi:hypothetical protein
MSSRRFFTLVITLVWIGIAVTRAMAKEITVTQAVVCQEIVDRMPVGAGDVIPAGTDRVFCFTQIDGIQATAEITHNWYYQGSLLELFSGLELLRSVACADSPLFVQFVQHGHVAV